MYFVFAIFVLQLQCFTLEMLSTMWMRAMDMWRSKCGEREPICQRLAQSLYALVSLSLSLQKVSSLLHTTVFLLSLYVLRHLSLLWFLPPSSASLSVLPPAGIDYMGISRNLDFAPGVSMQTFRVTILDDLGHPELEGTETFDLVLRMPGNGILGEPTKATVFINDSVSDCKGFDFLLPGIFYCDS